MYTAFQYGAPPHAGMAPGIDRIIMLLTGEENLREVQIFPPNVSGQDLLMGGPTEVTEAQLRETHLKSEINYKNDKFCQKSRKSHT